MASTSHPSDPPPPEVLPWLKTLPLAPEYHPTLAEFQDPISFILKIEKEASSYGICKIVPPLPPPPKKTSISNLNRSFAARDPGAKRPPTFTTRQQQIGFCPRRPRPVQKPVWQSGERYTLQQFEARAKQFERSLLKKHGRKTPLAPLEMETLFWKACVDRPFSVEYANDMPGSGFAPVAGVGAGGGGGRRWRDEAAGNVGETAWNMRGVSRAKGSLLRFMKEEIAGVTSPMVYVAMMFSWFAWHVEDHDLHSLNYLHLGASKTWYGVPRDARLAFEDVVRVHGYAGEVNPLVTFSILGEKTTVMSPEILVGAGIPCCRLVQNAGEFVVTFPGAYHTGFSHGFNCGEAANIATPEWLRFAKEAAVRRASTNFPPMVSHFQLLYALALSLSSRLPMISSSGPRSSRLKDKMKGEGEVVIKNTFVQSVAQNNRLLNVLLEKGSPCVILPQKALDISFCSGSLVRPQIKVNPRLSLGLCSREEGLEASGILPSHGVRPGRDLDVGQSNCSGSIKGRPIAEFEGKKFASAACSKYGTSDFCSTTSDPQCIEGGRESAIQGDGLFDQGLLSCVTCGILSFACVAVIQPREATAGYLMSADCSFFNDQIVGSGDTSEIANATNTKTDNYDIESCSGSVERHFNVKSDEKFAHHGAYLLHVSDRGVEVISGSAIQNKVSALDLIVSAYGDLSESEDDAVCGNSVCNNGDEIRDSSSSSDQNHRPRMPFTSENICTTKFSHDNSEPELIGLDLKTGAADNCKNLSFVIDNCSELPVQDSGDIVGSDNSNGLTSFSPENKSTLQLELSRWNHPERMGEASPTGSSNDCDTKGITNIGGTGMKMRNPEAFVTEFSEDPYSCHVPAAPTRGTATEMQLGNCSTMIKSSSILSKQRSDKDSSRMHVFCLEHAVEVEKQLRPVGGVHIMLLCHPDYPRIEAEAKLLAEELGSDHSWKDIPFQEATKEDQERIRLAMEDEEAIPTNSDWAVKMGINLYYSANLSKSPLYCKQMPYNSVIYTAFGYKSAGNSPVKPKSAGRRLGRQKKIVVAGKWCGKVWMSNQVHPYLARREDTHEQDHAHKVHSEGTDEKPKIETDTELVRQTTRPKRNSSTTPAARKSGKKRKTTLNKASTKKRRCAPSENSPLEEVKENSSVDCARHLRSSHLKQNSSSCSKISRQHKLNVQDEAGGPSTRLRKRPLKNEAIKTKPRSEKQSRKRKGNKIEEPKAATNKEDELEYPCDMEGCSMSFGTKQDLALHKRNICPVKGCGKKFFSHKYLVQHRKVHLDDRPLKCPWKGCRMSFKWAWARTEHIRVHTGDRPYVCREAGCGQTFRFVSDFSRHKRKTGHSVKKGRR